MAPLPTQPDPDLPLVRAIQAGDTRAWSGLLARYQDRLFAVCYRMVPDRTTAADLTQDAMVKIIQGLTSFDGTAKVSTWMIRVTMNVCLSHLRGAKLRRHASLEATSSGSERGAIADRLASGEPGVDQGVQQQEALRLVAAGLDRLEAEQRAILVLRDVRGLDYDQIAEILGTAVGTVKSRLFRARAALRDAVKELKGDSERADQ
ncbi:MAG: RNA polymerase sigma factor [Phycisphaerales bacterium]